MPVVLIIAAVLASAAPAAQPAPPLRPLSGSMSGLQSAAPAGLRTGGLGAPGTGLPAPRMVGDPAPQCRAQCAKDRAVCGVNEEDRCTERWAQCVSACARGGG